MWWSYVRGGYANNPHEIEARRAGAAAVMTMDEILAHRDRHRPRLPAGLGRAARRADPRPPRRGAAMIEVDESDAEVTEGEHVARSRTTRRSPPRPSRCPSSARRPPSAIDIDLETGELAAPIGTIDHLADAVLALARRSAASRSRAPSSPPTIPRPRSRSPPAWASRSCSAPGTPVRAVIRPETPADYDCDPRAPHGGVRAEHARGPDRRRPARRRRPRAGARASCDATTAT